MRERDEQARPADQDGWQPQGATRVPPAADDWRERTTPGLTPVPGPVTGRSAGAGWDARPGSQPEAYDAYDGDDDADATAPAWSSRPVSLRRPDGLAGLLLLLAGATAGLSLLLDWVRGAGRTGLDLLLTALRTAADDRGAFFADGWWEPVAILLGGGLLLVLGLLVLLPARTHRALGLLTLVVALAVAAAVLTPMAQDGFSTSRYAPGWWAAAAVGALGLLGALKAFLTGPRRRRAD
jgi:hypothetical protein